MIVTISMLKQRYGDYSNPLDKIKRECDKGHLIRLTRGRYETSSTVSPYLLASTILSPSYLSFDFALSFYGFIPERVVTITSASFKQRKKKVFENDFGRYEFIDIPPDAFPLSTTYIEEGEYAVRIASREKAICDSLCKWKAVSNISELKELLFEDKRIDVDEFASLDFKTLLFLAPHYKKKNLDLLTKLIKKEYAHE